MNRLGLIFGTGLLLVACWSGTVSSRSIDAISESEASQNDDLSALNIPAVLEFEGGDGDSVDGVRDKRTPRIIFRTVSCLFIFLINPGCLQGIMGGAGGGGSGGGLSSFGSNRRQQSSQPYYMISLPRYNDSDSNGTATEYPIYPIESTSEYPDEPPRPTNPIMAFIRWKMNLIPNMLRRFFPGFMGGRSEDGGGFGSGGGPLSGLLSALRGGGGGGGGFGGLGGFGGGRLARLFGGQGGEGGLGGGFGGFGGGNQY